uniref:Uncharacterized protein n=1 Tax=Acrobeloides nanus TaxID=290746 RepID=A0A914EES5_9BILA
MWRAYANLDALLSQYNHLVVNHGVTFVDRQIGAHTQSIESKNGQLKEFVRRKYGIHDEPFTSHLREFLGESDSEIEIIILPFMESNFNVLSLYSMMTCVVISVFIVVMFLLF